MALPHLYGAYSAAVGSPISKIFYFLYLIIVITLQVYWWWWPFLFRPCGPELPSTTSPASLSSSSSSLSGLFFFSLDDWSDEYRKHYAGNLRFFSPRTFSRVVPDSDHTVLMALYSICCIATFFSI